MYVTVTVVDDDPPVAVHDSNGSDIMQPVCMLMLLIDGSTMYTLNLEWPSYFDDAAIRICGVETVNVALCFPEDDGLQECSLAVVQVLTKPAIAAV